LFLLATVLRWQTNVTVKKVESVLQAHCVERVVRLLQLDECTHSQLSGVVSLLQDSVEVDDEMKSKLKDTCHSVTELSANRASQLRKSLLVRYEHSP